jgi:GT2 family glycosyltransferase
MSIAVVMCVYTMERLETIERGLRAVLAQEPRPDEVVVVTDHNEELRDLLAARFPDIKVVPNDGPRGLSSARNTGVRNVQQQIVAFLDDDAEPEPGWLAGLARPFRDAAVVGVGGLVLPAWVGAAPEWFPDEYLWVVGCSYRGQPTSGRVRNPLGCSMAFRSRLFSEVGAFHLAVGRLGTLPLGAEETEFCLRVQRANPDSRIVMVEDSVVRHRVPESRQSVSYFLRRCFYEGVSKAMVRGLSDGSALRVERRYMTRTLPAAALDSAGDVLRLRRPITAAQRFLAVAGGLGAAGIGYLTGLAAGRTRGRRAVMAA